MQWDNVQIKEKKQQREINDLDIQTKRVKYRQVSGVFKDHKATYAKCNTDIIRSQKTFFKQFSVCT